MLYRIVIADDFAPVRNIVRTLLETQAYEVLEAADGREALNYFDGRPVDLLVTDQDMPRLDGLNLTRQLRASSTYQYLPILMFSAQTDPHRKQEARECGVSGFLPKPYTASEFLTKVQHILR